METDKFRHSLNYGPVKSSWGDFIVDIPLAYFDPPSLSFPSARYTLPLVLFSLYFSFRKAVREPIFPRNVRIPTREESRRGLHIGALFYKYLSSFESIGDRALLPSFSPLPFLPSVLLRALPISEAELPGVYLFLQIFYTFRTRICIHNGRGRPEPALPSRLRSSSPRSSTVSVSLLVSLFVPLSPW